MNNNIKANGFTLIELLVVIAVIGVLVSVSLFGLRQARESARDTARKSDLEAIRSALELYKADCNRYPAAASVPFGGDLVGDGVNCDAGNVYRRDIPDDVVTGRNYDYVYDTPSGGYTLCAALETETTEHAYCNDASANCAETCSYGVINP